jgi:hypothetical protein
MDASAAHVANLLSTEPADSMVPIPPPFLVRWDNLVVCLFSSAHLSKIAHTAFVVFLVPAVPLWGVLLKYVLYTLWNFVFSSSKDVCVVSETGYSNMLIWWQKKAFLDLFHNIELSW